MVVIFSKQVIDKINEYIKALTCVNKYIVAKINFMGKKIIRLTESELAHIIKEATVASLNEMDGATYARIYNATHKAKQDIQSGNLQTTKTTTNRYKKDGSLRKKPLVKTTLINNDDIITRGRNMEDGVQQHWLKDFIGQTFMFFGEDRLGIPAHILLTLNKVTKLDPRKTILVGTVVYNNTKIEGDGIIIDFTTDKVKYNERGSRYAYTLEIDYRSRELWQKLLDQLKMALDNRKLLPKNFKEWYWVEVSEAVEHYLKKYDGYPIPNIYASLILQKDVELMEDGVHYKRNVGVDNIPYIKAVYGFKDETLYNKVLEEIDNYDDFRKRINSIKESFNNYTDDINKALMIIENIYVYHIEDRFNEMTPYWYKCIKWSIKILNDSSNKDKNISKYIQMGIDLIDEMPLITINRI